MDAAVAAPCLAAAADAAVMAISRACDNTFIVPPQKHNNTPPLHHILISSQHSSTSPQVNVSVGKEVNPSSHDGL
jgi:hypothetical protein